MAVVFVVLHGAGHSTVRHHLFNLLSAQDPSLCSCWSPTTSSHSTSSLVLHLSRFCQRTASCEYYPILFLHKSYPLPKEMLSSYYNMFFVCMVSQVISSLTGDPSSPFAFGEFCSLVGATFSLSSEFHPQLNGQWEHNQEMGTILHCLSSRNLSSWSRQLLWVEYAYNTLLSSATGLSPFQCSWGYQPPLFPEQEREANIPSAFILSVFIRCCR